MANLSNINNKFLVTTGGNVGIGTTSPTAKLKVIGDNDAWTCQIENTQALPYGLSVNTTGTAGTTFNSAFYTHSGTGMYIVNNGQVGIGTTSPAVPLHINHGSSSVALYTYGGYNHQAKFESSDAEAAIIIQDSNSTNNGNRIGVITNDMTFITDDVERMRIDSSGDVGIGTTPETAGSTWRTLFVGSSLSFISRQSSSGYDSIVANNYYVNSSNADKKRVTGTSSRMFLDGDVIRFQNAGSGNADATISWSERMRIDSSGNVGIGTTNPDWQLEVADSGTVRAAVISTLGFGTAGVYFKVYGDGNLVGNGTIRTDSAGTMSFWTGTSGELEQMRITTEGQIYNYESVNRANTAFGYDSGNRAITTANGNTTYGYNTGHAITSGCCNTLIGRDVGANITTGAQNVGVGQTALNSVTTALELVAVGYNSMITATTSSQCTAVGTNTLKFNTGNYNDAFGFRAGESNTTGAENSFIGRYSGFSNTTGSANTACGNAALESNTTGGNNTGLGYLALYDSTTASYNTAAGGQALRRNTTGSRMTAVGYEAGSNNTTGNYSTYVGYLAGQQATTAAQVVAVGDYAFNANNAGLGTAVGQGAGQLTTTGEGNTFLGCAAGQYNQTGHYNVAVGFLALGNTSPFSKTGIVAIGQKASYFHTADYDVYVGYQAGYAAGTGGANVGIGFRSLHDNSSGDSNVGIGYEALRQNTTGVGNSCIGRDAGRALTTGSRNTMVGAYVGQLQTTSGDNTLIGYVAGDAITSGGANTLVGSYAGSAITTGNHNTMLGYATGDVQTTANYNTLIGNICGSAITTGGNNTGVGHECFRFLTTGTINTAIGLSAMESSTTAYHNTALGYRALRNCYTGAGNIAIGFGAGINVTSGGSNIAIGYSAMGSSSVTGGGNIAFGDASGYELTSGANNVLIGKNSGRNTTGTDSLAQVTTQSNQIQIGNKTHTDAKVNISWTIVSDKRDKTKIKKLNKGLDFVQNLNPVSFERRKNRESQETDNKERYGFLAQDVLELEGENPVIVNNEDKNNLKLTSDYIIPILVNSIKELKAEIELLKSK